MRHRDTRGLEGVRRALAISLAMAWTAGASAAFAGIGVVPKKSIVQVTIKSESDGISIQDRYYFQTKVQELIQLTGLVGADGYVLAFAGGHLPRLNAPAIQSTFNVRTFDGKGYPAALAGIDERLSMIYLKAPVPRDLAVTFSNEPIQGNFKLAVLDDDRLRTAEPCPREQKTLSFIPALELKLAELDLKASWSGAAVVDAKGELLGLVANAWPHPFSSLVVSEIIPSELLRASFDTVRKTGRSIRSGWVGVYLEDVEKRTLVTDVIAETPAAKSGVRSKDVIVAVDGQPVGEVREFGRAVRSRSPGEKMGLTVERDGVRQVIPLVLGRRPQMEKTGWKVDVPGMMGGGEKEGFKLYRSFLPPLVDQGLVVDSIPRQLALKLKSPIGGGLLVEEVRDGSSGQKAGFLAGDVIFLINGNEVLDLTQAREVLEAVSKATVEVRLVRDGRVKSLTIALQ